MDWIEKVATNKYVLIACFLLALLHSFAPQIVMPVYRQIDTDLAALLRHNGLAVLIFLVVVAGLGSKVGS